MPPCAAGEACKFPCLDRFESTCYYCNAKLHGLCATEVDIEFGKITELCPSCLDPHVSSSEGLRGDCSIGTSTMAVINENPVPLPPSETGKADLQSQLNQAQCIALATGAAPGYILQPEDIKKVKDVAKAISITPVFADPTTTSTFPALLNDVLEKSVPPPLANKRSARPTTLFGGLKPSSKSRPPFVVIVSSDNDDNHPVKIDITKVHRRFTEPKSRIIVPGSKKTSVYWLAVHIVLPEDPYYVGSDSGKSACICCNLCSAILQISGGPTPIGRHLASDNCKSPYGIKVNRALEKEDQRKNSLFHGETQQCESDKGYKRSSASQTTLANMVLTTRKKSRHDVLSEQKKAVADANDAFAVAATAMNLPLTAFDNPTFRRMIKSVANCVRAGSNKFYFGSYTVKKHIYTLSHETKQLLMTRIKGRTVIATADHWTSKAKENYAALTVQFIENFKMHHFVLAVYLYEGSTSANLIVADFVKKLKEWNIHKSAPFLVTDTEAKMNAAGQLLAKSPYYINHLYCLDHLMQMVAVLAYDASITSGTETEVESNGLTSDCSNDEVNENSGNYQSGAVDRDNNPPPAVLPKIVSKPLLQKVRRLATYFNKSTQARAALHVIQKECQKTKQVQVDLMQDVVTRWWSTMSMLDRLFHLREALALYHVRHGLPKGSSSNNDTSLGVIEVPTQEEWDALDVLQKVLSPFMFAQKVLEGNKYVTSSLVAHIVHSVRRDMDNMLSRNNPVNLNPSVRTLVHRMKLKFNEIFGSATEIFHESVMRGKRNRQIGLHKALLFAHVLDPRFKHGPAGADRENKQKLWGCLLEEAITTTTKNVLAEVRAAATVTMTATLTDGEPQSPSTNTLFSSSSEDKGSPGLGRHSDAYLPDVEDMVPNSDRSACESRCKDEVARYRHLPSQAMITDFDVLAWWEDKAKDFPILWQLAEVYLAIPATAASSERAFSLSGNIVTIKRCSLNPRFVEASHMLHENYWVLEEERSWNQLYNDCSVIENEDETYELE